MLKGLNAYKKRVILLAVVMFAGLGFVVYRLAAVQIVLHEEYRLRAKRQQTTEVVLVPRRGDILDREGNLLATSSMVYTVYCEPGRITSKHEEIAERLASILYKPYPQILDLITRNDRKCVLLSRKTSPEDAREIESVVKEFGLSRFAIFFRKEGKREYPYGDLLSPVLGYVVLDKYGDNQGMGGLEYQYDKYLRGGTPKVVTSRGAARILLDYLPEEALEKSRGASLVLTVNASIQYIAEKELRDALAREKADAGSVVVLDIPTGEILAMASLPSFDPNEFSYYPLDLRRNNALSYPIPPGSVMKIFTFATLLEHDLMQIMDPVDCGSGRTVYFNGRPIKDAPGHALDVVPACMAFYYSSNVGTAHLIERIDNDIYYSQLNAFGFGRKTGLDLPGEDDGILHPVHQWSLLSKVSLAIGYEISVTSLQVARAAAAIANNGNLMRPYIVKKIVGPRNEVLFENNPNLESKVVRPSVSERMIELMEGVVQQGTGKKAQIPGYRIGGKTGTAMKAPYTERKYVSSFLGILPIESPRLCIYVWIDNPRGKHYGGDVSAPVFKNVAEAAIKALHIPPTMPVNPEPLPLSALEVARQIEEESPECPLVAPEQQAGVMPDLRNMTMRTVYKELRKHNVKPQFVGSGIVVDQSPQPGAPIGPGTSCLIVFGKEFSRVHHEPNLQNGVNQDI